MTCPTDNALAQLVDGNLDDLTRLTLERHLGGCASCSELVGELARLLAPVDTRRARDRPLPPGITERAWRGAEPRTRAEILDVWQRALAELAAVHRTGATRVVSPDHVFVDGDTVRLDDLAVVKSSGYLAPEQLRGGPASPRSDQFAICVAIWEALAGDQPFHGATPGALAVAATVPPTPPDAAFKPLVRGLAADPAARWPGVDALAHALARPRQTGATITAFVMAALIVLLAVVARQA